MYLDKQEKEISKEYLSQGFVVRPVYDKKAFLYIKKFIISKITQSKFFKKSKLKETDVLNNTHKFVNKSNLNDFRIDMLKSIFLDKKLKENYYLLGKPYLDILVGNELAMQKRINLSIQLPNDDSSLLPMHADLWSGDSSFETVLWVPLVDCYKTKSMYILPPNKYDLFLNLYNNIKYKSSEKLYKKIKKHLSWIKINEGEVLIFNQNLPHGNAVNLENETRWTFNCRFKSLFSPYAQKKLGEFFEPISLKAVTQQGMKFKLPEKK